jgi:hypothetical protein
MKTAIQLATNEILDELLCFLNKEQAIKILSIMLIHIEIEKKQIIEAVKYGSNFDNAEQYYKETFETINKCKDSQ